ncbi:MAG: UDP-N-acetylglucosamine 2-epimerase (non-hydrolyzing) [Planctomycetes bacterium]|nr:UDP-N-acetylglucosamine 2-epimerase (non-hydrolyzing) [Planctomycetota bacterium]
MRESGNVVRIGVCVGTRPEAIKLAPVARALAGSPGLAASLLFAGQHRELAEGMLGWFDLRPALCLDVMTEGQTVSGVLSRLLARIEGPLLEGGYSAVVVQGDTATAYGCALAAFLQQIPVIHVEAGVRTSRPDAPFPEEMFRRMIDQLATLRFPATASAGANLAREGLSCEVPTGNTGIDALEWTLERLDRLDAPRAGAGDREPATGEPATGVPVHGVPVNGRPVVLVTAHRRESIGEPLRRICEAVARLSGEAPEVDIVLPVHPNPQVADTVRGRLGALPRVHLTEPLDYPSMVQVLRRSRLVLTDSGGVQEEIAHLGIPGLVLREVTDRPEGVRAGFLEVVGTGTEEIVGAALRVLRNGSPLLRAAASPYGDGRAAARIAARLAAYLGCASGAGSG